MNDAPEHPTERLGCVLVSDPLVSIAQGIARQCENLAHRMEIATTGTHLLEQVQKVRPNAVILSLDLTQPPATSLIDQLVSDNPESLIVVTYREMTVPMVKRLKDLGIEHMLEHPVDITAIYRAASGYFGQPYRRHDRFSISLDLTRPDGVLIGRTLDLSEGGLRMEAIHPVSTEQSFLVDLDLNEDTNRIRVRCSVLAVEGHPPLKVTARLQFEKLRGREYDALIDFIEQLRQKEAPLAGRQEDRAEWA